VELTIGVLVAAGLAGLYVWAKRSLRTKREAKAAVLRELYGQQVTLFVAARISISRLRQVFELQMQVGEVVERHGQLRVLVEDLASVEVGRDLLRDEQLLAAEGIALDDIYSLVTREGERHAW
jgi:hypothetical protein